MTAPSVSATLPPAPTVDHPVTLTFQGDWGQANMHRICGWLSQEIGDRTPPGSRFAIWSGRGGSDAFDAVLSGRVDIAISTPTAEVSMRMSRTGAATFEGAEHLRALGTLPQRDRLVVCVDAALEVTAIEDLATVEVPLRIATSPDDGVNSIGLAAHALLRASGVDPQDVVERGGSFDYHERPFPAIAAFAQAEANVLIHEAIMMPAWQRVTDVRAVKYLPISDAAAGIFAEQGWPTATVDADYLPGLAHDLRTLEFSDFLVLCREDLPEDIAALAAWCMVATRKALEAQYQHIPAHRSPLTYPLDPKAIATTPIPLHPAAEATYRQLGDATVSNALMWD